MTRFTYDFDTAENMIGYDMNMKKIKSQLLGLFILSQLLVTLLLCAQTHTLIVEPEDGSDVIVDVIKNARKTIDITIYEINDPQINAALLDAKKRGVNVRIIYNYYSFEDSGKPMRSQDAINTFVSSGIRVKKASERYEITHQKTITVDDEKSIIMTFNLLPDYFSRTRDFGIITVDKKEIAEIKQVFESDWNYVPAFVNVKSLVWSPTNSRQKILGLINNAKQTIDIYTEEIQDDECINALINAASRGVRVRVISARMDHSGEDPNAKAREKLNDNGVSARYCTSLYIHAKIILVDDKTDNAVAFVGSENLSRVSLDRNRELGILVYERDIINRLSSIFQSDWEKTFRENFEKTYKENWEKNYRENWERRYREKRW